jgi:hypothetical protein
LSSALSPTTPKVSSTAIKAFQRIGSAIMIVAHVNSRGIVETAEFSVLPLQLGFGSESGHSDRDNLQ